MPVLCQTYLRSFPKTVFLFQTVLGNYIYMFDTVPGESKFESVWKGVLIVRQVSKLLHCSVGLENPI
jgi:hypothetical protein